MAKQKFDFYYVLGIFVDIFIVFTIVYVIIDQLIEGSPRTFVFNLFWCWWVVKNSLLRKRN